MRWRGRVKSTNVEDRRGETAGRLRLGRGPKLGGLGLIIIITVIVLGGGDVEEILSVLLSPDGQPIQPDARIGLPSEPADPEAADFVGIVLKDIEDTWQSIYAAQGQRYPEPRLVLFDAAANSACGFASAATGPFYCPNDQKVYLDTSFFRDLERLGAPGDFAQAYVIAHEVGHHVQNIAGTLEAVMQRQQAVSPEDANALQVLTELQADCLAGVWGSHAAAQGDFLEPGDVEEGLRAAAAIGDDRLQRNAGRRIQPETFTHGTSEQRVAWFRRGLESGNSDACDTFSTGGRA